MSQPKPPITLDAVDVNTLELIKARLNDVTNLLLQWSQEALKHQKTYDDYMARLGVQKGFDPKEFELDIAGKRMVPKVAPPTP